MQMARKHFSYSSRGVRKDMPTGVSCWYVLPLCKSRIVVTVCDTKGKINIKDDKDVDAAAQYYLQACNNKVDPSAAVRPIPSKYLLHSTIYCLQACLALGNMMVRRKGKGDEIGSIRFFHRGCELGNDFACRSKDYLMG